MSINVGGFSHHNFQTHIKMHQALEVPLASQRLFHITTNTFAQTKKNMFYPVMTGDDFESSLLSFEKLDRASPDLWPEQCKFNFSLLVSFFWIIYTFCSCCPNLDNPVISQ